MTCSVKTSYAASLLLLVSSITILPLFSQENHQSTNNDVVLTLSYEEKKALVNALDTLITAGVTNVTNAAITQGIQRNLTKQLTPEEHNELKELLQELIKEAKDEKKDKECPTLRAAHLITIFIRFPLLVLYYEHLVERIKSGALGSGLTELLKATAITWFLGEPIKDHAKPFYEYYRDKFDNYIDDNFQEYLDRLKEFLGFEVKKDDESAPVAA